MPAFTCLFRVDLEARDAAMADDLIVDVARAIFESGAEVAVAAPLCAPYPLPADTAEADDGPISPERLARVADAVRCARREHWSAALAAAVDAALDNPGQPQSPPPPMTWAEARAVVVHRLRGHIDAITVLADADCPFGLEALQARYPNGKADNGQPPARATTNPASSDSASASSAG